MSATTTDQPPVLSNWTRLSHSVIFIVKGRDMRQGEENGTGTLNDLDRIKTVFQEMDTIVLREDQIDQTYNILAIVGDLSTKYKKIVFYYIGHSKNAGDEFPVISVNGYSLGLYALHRFLAQTFQFSVLISDSCNVVVARGGNLEIFQKVGPFDPMSIENLEYVMNNRGHLIVSSAAVGAPAEGYKNLGGVFTSVFLVLR